MKTISLFKDAIHEVVRKIPKGEYMTYKEVALKIGRPDASRAVGTVLSKNFNPEIPCHRVIRSDGKMGGYNRGGIEQKLLILKEEGAHI